MSLTYSQHLDALDFNEKCDGSLPLEDMIIPDPSIRKLFQGIDRSKARVWALTNAYKTVKGTTMCTSVSLTLLSSMPSESLRSSTLMT